ncbi:hypothetical protein NL676_039498 [Syzygium grande]|nr:hypothetical protein NL676_039498 [Syzygium grande]
MEVEGPTEILVDNQAALAISQNPVFHGRTKHFKIKFYYLREVQQEGEVKLLYCKTEDRWLMCLLSHRNAELEHEEEGWNVSRSLSQRGVVGDMDNEEVLTKNFMFNVMFVGIFASIESISTMLALIFKFLFETPRGSRGINGNKIYMISKNIVLHHIVKPYSTMATSILHAEHTVILERREGQSTAL